MPKPLPAAPPPAPGSLAAAPATVLALQRPWLVCSLELPRFGGQPNPRAFRVEAVGLVRRTKVGLYAITEHD